MERSDLSLSERTAAVMADLEAKRGAVAAPSAPSVQVYKVMGKTFAILSLRGLEAVSLKCDPHLAEVLREQHAGVGHRYHLDRRHWISVRLDADVLAAEVERLVAQSYDLVCANLTRAERARLAAMAG